MTDHFCSYCNGSGEGRHDGTTCVWCRGSGEANDDDDMENNHDSENETDELLNKLF